MNTASVTPSMDISFGGRLQRNMVKGQDDYNASADPNAGFYATNPQAPPVDIANGNMPRIWAPNIASISPSRFSAAPPVRSVCPMRTNAWAPAIHSVLPLRQAWI